MTLSETVLQRLDDHGVLQLTLNRPERKNAFNVEQWAAFRDAIAEARENPAVAVVLVTGAGGNFSSGTDLSEFATADADHPFASCTRVLAAFDKPLVAAATGVAVGGGATLLLHCDVVYVGQLLRMRLPFVSLGLVPEFGSSQLLQARIGSRRAAELLFTAEWIDSARAVATGIATAAVGETELLAVAQAKAREIAQWPVRSLQATKQLLKRVHEPALTDAIEAEEEAMARLAGSPENVEAIMAFLEKRPADFRQFRHPTKADS